MAIKAATPSTPIIALAEFYIQKLFTVYNYKLKPVHICSLYQTQHFKAIYQLLLFINKPMTDLMTLDQTKRGLRFVSLCLSISIYNSLIRQIFVIRNIAKQLMRKKIEVVDNILSNVLVIFVQNKDTFCHKLRVLK